MNAQDSLSKKHDYNEKGFYLSVGGGYSIGMGQAYFYYNDAKAVGDTSSPAVLVTVTRKKGVSLGKGITALLDAGIILSTWVSAWQLLFSTVEL